MTNLLGKPLLDSAARTLTRGGKSARQKFAAVAQAFGVDAVADAGGQMPLDRHAERGQPLRRLEQRLRRNELVAIAVDEQHRRARFDLGGEGFELAVPAATTSSPE